MHNSSLCLLIEILIMILILRKEIRVAFHFMLAQYDGRVTNLYFLLFLCTILYIYAA